MRGWIRLTVAVNGEVNRYSVAHILRYAATSLGDGAKSSVGLTNGGSIRVRESPEEIDELIEQAT
jgi:hypothetical protein